MRKILLFTLLLIVSCNDEKKELPAEFIGSEQHLLEFLERKIRLPKDYEKSGLEEYAEIIKNQPDSKVFNQYQLDQIENFKKQGENIELFVQKDNYFNNISFQLGRYIKLDKSLVNMYVNLLETNVFPASEQYGIRYERLESKFIKINQTDVIKVKYIQTFNERKIYLTQYLISYKLQTFGMIVSNDKNTDYQYLLKNFAI